MASYTHASSYTPAIGRINQEDVGKLALRIALGVLILFHGVAKLTGGIDFITDVVVKAGLPSFVAYGVYVGEVVAPLMLIAGWHTRLGAALIAKVTPGVALRFRKLKDFPAIRVDNRKLGESGIVFQQLQAAQMLRVATDGTGRHSDGGVVESFKFMGHHSFDAPRRS